jgi:hypothetical protein
MYEEQCAEEIKAIQEFPEEVARLKVEHKKRWVYVDLMCGL